MDTTDNTGLGLIKQTIERVQNQKSLFISALKKLVNMNEKQLGEFLGKTVPVQIIKNLAFVWEITIKNVISFVVGERFQNRAKNKAGIPIWMSDVFMSKIINPLKNASLSFTTKGKLNKFILVKPLNDTEIQTELNNPQSIDVEVFLPLIWGMISLQKNGKEKPDGLLNNGYANIFHIKLKDGSIVGVSVYWADDEWRFIVCDFDNDNRWGDGVAFFTFATAL